MSLASPYLRITTIIACIHSFGNVPVTAKSVKDRDMGWLLEEIPLFNGIEYRRNLMVNYFA